MNTGVFDEACFPYTASDAPCDNRCSDWEDRIYFRSTLNQGVGGGPSNLDQLKSLVMEQPVYSVMSVYTDFNSYSGGVYEHSSGSYSGLHAVVLVGWDDTDSFWICKNSWGSSWGESGYFNIKYFNCGIGGTGYRVRVAPRVEISSGNGNTLPDSGRHFINTDSLVHFFANNPVMGNADTIFRPIGAFIDGFRSDSMIMLDTFTLRIDGPIEVNWLWDTIVGIDKIPLHVRSHHGDASFEISYIKATFDTTLHWMAESTVVIRADSIQLLTTTDYRQEVVSWDSWSNDGSREQNWTMSSSGEDSIRAFFNSDTVRFWTIFQSDPNFRQLKLNDATITTVHRSFVDSGYTHTVVAKDHSDAVDYEIFSHWIPYHDENTLHFQVFGYDTIRAVFDRYKKTWFANSFGDGLVKINHENHIAAAWAAHLIGDDIVLNVCDDQAHLGHWYEFEMWSNSISEEHTLNMDFHRGRPPNFIALYNQKSSTIVFTEHGESDYGHIISPTDSAVTVSIVSDTITDDFSRLVCSSWHRGWIEYDTVFYEGFHFEPGPAGGALETHPEGWIEDGIHNDEITDWASSPLIFPQAGTGMMRVANNSHTAGIDTAWTISPAFTVPDDADSVRLSFWMIESPMPDDYDSLWIQVSNDDGASWERKGTFTNQGDVLDWKKHTIGLDEYAGDELQLRIKTFINGTEGSHGSSAHRIYYDEIFIWAAYSYDEEGTGSSASFVPDWNCSLVFNWHDEYFIEVLTDFGIVEGFGWYKIDSLAEIVATDSIVEDDWLFVFREWEGIVETSDNPHSFPVTDPGTIWARYDTFVMARVSPDVECSRVIVDYIDTLPSWNDWVKKGDSIFIDALPSISCGTDSMAYFRIWSDSSAIAHYFKLDAPDSVKALYDYYFLCRLEKLPHTGLGWVAMDFDTAMDSISNWIRKGESFHISASDSDYNFASSGLWIFDGFSDGIFGPHYTAIVEQPTTIYAEYNWEDFFLNIELTNEADSIWSIIDVMEYGEVVLMDEHEAFEVINRGNSPVDLGIQLLGHDHDLWSSDSIAGYCIYNVRARFQPSMPLLFDRHYDFVKTAPTWTTNVYLGPDGWELYPGQQEKLWLYLALPLDCAGHWGETNPYWIRLSVISRYWMP